MTRGRASGRRGFTLVEMAATMSIVAVVSATAAMVLARAAEGYASAATRSRLHAEVSTGLDRLVREIRQIPVDAEGSPPSPRISRVDRDGLEYDGGRIERSGGEVRLGTNGSAPAPLLENVVAFTVEAFDGEGEAIALPATEEACAGVRRIVITISVERDGVRETLRGAAHLRGTMTHDGGEG